MTVNIFSRYAQVLEKAFPVLLACALLATLACGGQERGQLSQAQREEVAQRYADSIRAISALTDSLCNVQRSTLVVQLSDSLVELRLADIERQQSAINE